MPPCPAVLENENSERAGCGPTDFAGDADGGRSTERVEEEAALAEHDVGAGDEIAETFAGEELRARDADAEAAVEADAHERGRVVADAGAAFGVRFVALEVT